MKERHIVAGLLIICSAGLIALLALKGFNRREKTLTPEASVASFQADFNAIIAEEKKALTDFEKAFVTEQDNAAKEADTSVAFPAARTLVKFWDSTLHFGLSGYYYSLMAQKEPSEFNLMNASQRFYEHSLQLEDSSSRIFFINKATEGFKKVLDMNPGNLDAKVGYALCIIDDRSRIMEGVPLLREVLAADSNHVMANFRLGLLQIESGQLQKALVSFKKLVSLQPFNGQFYFYLADIQRKMGQNQEAVKNLEIAKTLTRDEDTRKGIDNIINEIKDSK